MKKTAIVSLCLALALILAACAPAAYAGPLTGTPEEILQQIQAALDAGQQNDGALPPAFEQAVTAENAQNMLGLTGEQFTKYVDAAASSTAAIMTVPHELALVKAKDAAAAAEVKKLIAAGFDSHKWVCVAPQQSAVMAAGQYVLLAVSKKETADAALAVFAQLAATTGNEPDVFFTSEGNAGAPGGGLEFAPPLLEQSAPPAAAQSSAP